MHWAPNCITKAYKKSVLGEGKKAIKWEKKGERKIKKPSNFPKGEKRVRGKERSGRKQETLRTE